VGLPPLDLGNLRPAPLEAAQQHLGRVVGELLRAGAVPVVLGGGHETAYGHFLGYVAAGLPCTILNVDAHLDVRPYPDGPHSGSPFRQAFEHPAHSLNRGAYHVVGAQLPSVARAHAEFVRQRGGRIIWADELTDRAVWDGAWEGIWRSVAGRPVFLTVDADAFSQADVPGVSAPNPVGLPGDWWPPLAAAAARHGVRSLEIVEINPAFDRDGQTARWAAAGLWRILAGP
jgi:formiminoglutamase